MHKLGIFTMFVIAFIYTGFGGLISKGVYPKRILWYPKRILWYPKRILWYPEKIP